MILVYYDHVTEGDVADGRIECPDRALGALEALMLDIGVRGEHPRDARGDRILLDARDVRGVQALRRRHLEDARPATCVEHAPVLESEPPEHVPHGHGEVIPGIERGERARARLLVFLVGEHALKFRAHVRMRAFGVEVFGEPAPADVARHSALLILRGRALFGFHLLERLDCGDVASRPLLGQSHLVGGVEALEVRAFDALLRAIRLLFGKQTVFRRLIGVLEQVGEQFGQLLACGAALIVRPFGLLGFQAFLSFRFAVFGNDILGDGGDALLFFLF